MDPGASDIKVTDPALEAGGKHVLTRQDFARLYESSYRTLWCVAAAVTSNRSIAADLVQDAAVIGMKKLAEFDPSTSYVAWMSQIVRYLALNEGRKRARENTGRAGPLALELAADPSGGRGSSSGVLGIVGVVESLLDQRLKKEMAALDETPRMCLVLRTTLDLSYKEIAAALGIPEGTAMSHVFRARKLLRDRLGGETEEAGPDSETSGTGKGRRSR